MTLVLAAKTKDGVYIGSDGWHHFDGRHKLIRIHNFIVGYTTSYRTGQLIEHSTDRFKAIQCRSDVFDFVQALKVLMQDDGQKKEAVGGQELDHAVGLLIATPDAIWQVGANYAFHEHERWAVGSGYLYGMGYLDALRAGQGSLRVARAIAATAQLVSSVGGEVTVWKADQ